MEHYLLGSYAVDTIDPECIQAVLKTQFSDFTVGDRHLQFGPLLGDGIFTQDGAAWKASRALLRPQFMETRTRSFPFIQEGVEELLSLIGESDGKTDVVNLQPLFFQLTINTTLAILCGHSATGSDGHSFSTNLEFAKAFDYAQSQLKLRSRLGPFYWAIDGPKFRRCCRVIREFAGDVVQRALEDRENNKLNGQPERYVFLEGLIASTQDPIVLRDQLINILIAGRDTTACLLSWTFKFLARYKDVQAELRQQCLNLASYKAEQLPTVAEIKGMTLLNNVLSETLRLYPSVPVNVRVANKDTTLPLGGGLDRQSPIVLPKGKAVGYSLYSMHRRKDIWGDDSEDFRPSRWTEEAKRPQGAYAPFNDGPRLCPGQEFALLEAGYTVVRFLQEYAAIEETSNEPKRFRHATTLVVAPKDGCNVRLRRMNVTEMRSSA